MLKLDLSGKVALVTGGSQGIGQAVVNRLQESGCQVHFTSRKGDEANEYHHALDFQDEASVSAFLDWVGELPALDILVNNAGLSQPQSIWSLTDHAVNQTMQTNLVGPLQLMATASQKLKKTKNGKIVNIASIAGSVSKPQSAAYSASKAGLLGATRSAAVDLAPFGILVNSVSPGPTHTPMVEKLLSAGDISRISQAIPLKKLAEADDIARVVLFLCSDLNTYLTGQDIVVDGGFTVI